MTEVIDLRKAALKAERGFAQTVARTHQDGCVGAPPPLHARTPQRPYPKESLIVSPIDTPITMINESEVETSALRDMLQRPSDRFLKGPIPVRWIVRAGELPGRALLVLLAIRHRADLARNPWVTLPAKVMADFRFDKFTKLRAVAELERAGLVRVRRQTGRATQMRLVSI